MKAITENDLVIGSSDGDLPGIEISNSLLDIGIGNLRFIGGDIVDARANTVWFIDRFGRKHIKQSDKSWQRVKCSIVADLVKVGDVWRIKTASEINAPAIKAECRRRIVAVLKDTPTQINLSGYVSELLAARVLDKGKLTANESADIEVARQTRAWVSEMQATSRRLIAAADESYADDAAWPAAPEGAAELAARF